ncbi:MULTISPECIES: NUDIX hydrolase [unclassified Thalassospira]|uniref:NUDIX hydrolase n=1 Tax=unclassified Thalassospira TaxID=2648997 RepID=UPI0025D0237B|nr:MULTISPECIES: NUDIX domain-containing protein [unclassified Thalassospira]|tara:strand:- start:672 stop:1097 length:426 start_codon:yes stop_codon:yes gene_type:complete
MRESNHSITDPALIKVIETANWILRDGENILSVRSHGRDRFYLPGGKIDPGETAREAIKREISEELGVDLIPGTLRELGTFAGQGHNQPDGSVVRMTCFTGHYSGTLAPASEIAELRWLSPRERHLMAPMGQKITAALFDI